MELDSYFIIARLQELKILNFKTFLSSKITKNKKIAPNMEFWHGFSHHSCSGNYTSHVN